MQSTFYRPALMSALLILVLTSCSKKFLETPPTANPVRQDYIKNLETSQEYLNGIYVELSANIYKDYSVVYPDVAADNLKPVGNSAFFMQYSWTQEANTVTSNVTSSSLNMNGLWTAGYKVVRACNYLLENIDRFRNENAGTADNIKGQAFAIRALVYHLLVNVFAQPYKFSADGAHPGIPYVISSDFTQPVPQRETVAAVYQKIIGDLSSAIELLPASSSNRLFIGRNAARAILARIYLFKGSFEEAKNLSRDVTAFFPLLQGAQYPARLFTTLDNETIFQLPPASISTGSYNTSFASYLFRRSIQFVTTSDLSNILNERGTADARSKWITNVSAGTWRVVKFPTNVVPAVSDTMISYYHPVIRSAEMFLTAAECYAQLGKVDSARLYLDSIRRRANATVPLTVATGGALLDSIYKERRKELAFEGLRLFDLLRTGKNIVRQDYLLPAPATLNYPSPKAIAPIPSIDVITYGLVQNLSY